MNTKPGSVVFTGSTRGIGYNLAEAFLERACHHQRVHPSMSESLYNDIANDQFYVGINFRWS